MARTPSALMKRLALAGAAAAIVTLAGWSWARNWTPSRADYPVQGLAVSEASGAVEWPRLAAQGADFAYLRATDGAAGRDRRFAENWRESGAAGVRRGAWHRFALCTPAREQAGNFIATVPREPMALPPAVEVAGDDGCAAPPDRKALLAELERFARMVEAHAERPVVLKLSKSIEARYRISEAIDRPLWLESRFVPPDYGAHPWLMWQANRALNVEGAAAPVGWNVLRP